jgi:hypothetical protein
MSDTPARKITMQNRDGQWVPAIPLPFYGLLKRCDCGARFWTARGYRGHYALVHILKIDSPAGKVA